MDNQNMEEARITENMPEEEHKEQIERTMEPSKKDGVKENKENKSGQKDKGKIKEKIAPEKVKGTGFKRSGVQKLNKQFVLIVVLGLTGITLLGNELFKNGNVAAAASAAVAPATSGYDVNAEIEKNKGKTQLAQSSDTQIQTVPTATDMAPPQPTSQATKTTASVKPTPQATPQTIKTAPAPVVEYEVDQYAIERQNSEAAARTSSLGGISSGTRQQAAGVAYVQPSYYGDTSAQEQTVLTPANAYKQWNDQQQKNEFKGEPKDGSVASLPSRPANTIYAGTIIPAVLVTAINTDLPGDILGLVTANVYDTVTGTNILIPQGSRLLAQYNSSVTWGQNRVQVAWQRLIRPDGVSIDLGNMTGVDATGMAGYKGKVDEHFGRFLGGLGSMALVSIVTGQLEYSAQTINPAGGQILNNMNEQIAQTGSAYVNNTLNIQPTIKIKQGTKVQVFVNTDLVMPSTPDTGVPVKYSLQGGK